MKKLFALLLALVLVCSLAGCVMNTTPDPTAPAKEEEKLQFTVVVVHKDQSEKTFQYAVAGGMLGDVLEKEGLIESEGADDGMFHTVDGEKADWNIDQSYWAFYEGEEYAMTGIYATEIVNGRTYKLVYTIG